LLSIGAKSFVFQFANQKFINQDIWNYNFPVVFMGVKLGR